MSPTLASPQPTTTFVKKSRIIRASRQDVYNAWTKPEILKKWFGPIGYVCTLAESDTRVGGIFRFVCEPMPETAVPPGAPRSALIEGVYTEVVPGERLQRTGTHSGNPGAQALLTVSFHDVEGGTEVTVLHEKLPSDNAHLYAAGWDGTLNKLDALFAA
jgi:uncharacterized protein YndB with AHSA1/START domain